MALAHVAPVGQHPRLLPRQIWEGRHQGETKLLDEAVVGPLVRPDHLPAELHEAPVGQRRLLNPPARPVARLEHHHVRSARGQVPGGGEPGQAAAQHDHVVLHRLRLK